MRALHGLLAFLLLPSLANAHDLWLEPAPAGYELRYGHAPGGHDGATTLAYDPHFVQRALCRSEAGQTQALPVTAGYPARFDAACAALWVEASSGVWTTTVQGTRNEPPDGLAGVVRAWRSIESTKRLEAWDEALSGPLGDGLELVPLENPFDLEPGRKLRLLVTLGGQPQPGANVAYGGEIRGVSGTDGQVNLRLRAAGLQFITASIRVRAGEPGGNETVYATTLHFVLE
jgi:nickel transport protein